MKHPVNKFYKGQKVVGTRIDTGEVFHGTVFSIHWHLARAKWQYTVQVCKNGIIRIFEEKELQSHG